MREATDFSSKKNKESRLILETRIGKILLQNCSESKLKWGQLCEQAFAKVQTKVQKFCGTIVNYGATKFITKDSLYAYCKGFVAKIMSFKKIKRIYYYFLNILNIYVLNFLKWNHPKLVINHLNHPHY